MGFGIKIRVPYVIEEIRKVFWERILEKEQAIPKFFTCSDSTEIRRTELNIVKEKPQELFYRPISADRKYTHLQVTLP